MLDYRDTILHTDMYVIKNITDWWRFCVSQLSKFTTENVPTRIMNKFNNLTQNRSQVTDKHYVRSVMPPDYWTTVSTQYKSSSFNFIWMEATLSSSSMLMLSN